MMPPSSPLMETYFQGPEPMGIFLRSSSDREAGKTLTRDRRAVSSVSKGYFRVMVTVVSSFLATLSMKVRKGPIVPAAMFSSKALTTSSTVTSVPSENLAPSRRETS